MSLSSTTAEIVGVRLCETPPAGGEIVPIVGTIDTLNGHEVSVESPDVFVIRALATCAPSAGGGPVCARSATVSSLTTHSGIQSPHSS